MNWEEHIDKLFALAIVIILAIMTVAGVINVDRFFDILWLLMGIMFGIPIGRAIERRKIE